MQRHRKPSSSRVVPGSSRESLNLTGGGVQVINNEIQMHPVLPGLRLRHPLEPYGQAVLCRGENQKLTVPNGRVHVDAEQFAPERGNAIGVYRVIARYPTFAGI